MDGRGEAEAERGRLRSPVDRVGAATRAELFAGLAHASATRPGSFAVEVDRSAAG